MTCNNCGSIFSPINVSSGCPDKFGCPPDKAPDFQIKRHDTMPPFRVAIDDCDGALDLTDTTLVLEANMWAKAKLRRDITKTDTYFAFADNIGFEQVMVNDIIIMDRVRLPEHMLVTGFDETNKLIQVQRGYHGTSPSIWKKGSGLKIFRILNGVGSIQLIRQDVIDITGITLKDQLTDTFLVYDWKPDDTCLPGCYWFEFKLLKMTPVVTMASCCDGISSASVIPSFTPSTWTPSNFGCGMGSGVEWVRRFPACGDGFLIKIEDSPTSEF